MSEIVVQVAEAVVVNAKVAATAATAVLQVGGGVRGPQGLASNASHVHTQAVADTLWTITHNLGFFPNVTVIEDSTGDVVIGAVAYVSNNEITITFSAALSGTAYLS